MLPIGAALSYYLIQRRAQALNVAGEGESAGGRRFRAGSASSARLAKSKDIVKPAGS